MGVCVSKSLDYDQSINNKRLQSIHWNIYDSKSSTIVEGTPVRHMTLPNKPEDDNKSEFIWILMYIYGNKEAETKQAEGFYLRSAVDDSTPHMRWLCKKRNFGINDA